MKKILFFLSLLIGLGATAQWSLSGTKVREGYGRAWSTKDSTAFTSPGDSLVLAMGSDSLFHYKYKGYWQTLSIGVPNTYMKYIDTLAAFGRYFTGGILKSVSFPALTGDITTPSGSLVTTLKSIGTPGTYGSVSAVPVFVTDYAGRVISVTNTAINIVESQVTNLVADLASKLDTNNIPIYHRDYKNTNPIYFLNGKKIVFFGNSLTAGSGASDTTQRFSSVLSSMLGGIEVNIGKAGMYIEKQFPLSSMGGKFSIDSSNLIPVYDSTYSSLIIELGANDVMFNGINYTVNNASLTLDTLISFCINTKKWIPKKILLLSTPYFSYAGRKYSDSIYKTYPTYIGISTIQRSLNFNQVIANESTKWGAMFVNIYDSYLANGDSSLLYTDGIHPNNLGHRVIANAIYSYLNGSNYKIPNLEVVGNARFDSSVILPPTNATAISIGNATLSYRNTAGILRLANRTIINRANGTLWSNESSLTQMQVNDTGLVISSTSRPDSIAPRKRLDVRGSAIIDSALQIGSVASLNIPAAKILVLGIDSSIKYRNPAQIISDGGGPFLQTIGGNVTGAIQFTANSGQSPGSISRNSSNGIMLYGITGSSYDNSMFNGLGGQVFANPTGTQNMIFSGAGTFSSSVTASSFITSGGTASQIQARDGSAITAGTGITISGGTISSSGTGVVPTVGNKAVLAQTTTQTLFTYVVGGTDRTFVFGGNLNLTAISSGSVAIAINYTRQDGTASTTYLYNQNTAGYYVSYPLPLRIKASTTVTVAITTPIAATGYTYDANAYMQDMGY